MNLLQQLTDNQQFLDFLYERRLRETVEQILQQVKNHKLTPKQGFNKLRKIQENLQPAVDIPVSEAIIRPTGLLDPIILLRPVTNQVDDILSEVKKRARKGQRTLITTLTKKFAEELDLYFKQINIKSAYLHSDIDTLERVEILSDLRKGKYDVLIGINLLREGLDLPEVALVAIFDADKVGLLRSKTSLVQIIGRAARHQEGTVIMYGETMTDAMQYAINETERRRSIQQAHNQKQGITPKSVTREDTNIVQDLHEEDEQYGKSEVAYTPFGFQSKEEHTDLHGAGKKNSHHTASRSKTGKQTQARQVYADFEADKDKFLRDLKKQNPSSQELQQLLSQAIEQMNFEKAAAIRDFMEGKV